MLLCLRWTLVVLSALLFTSYAEELDGEIDADSKAVEETSSWQEALKNYWLWRLGLNLFGYATIVVPGYLLIQHIHRSKMLDHHSNTGIWKFARLCVYGNEQDKATIIEEGGPTPVMPKPEPSTLSQTLKLLWCAGGLLSFYLVWGLIQERIMAFKYGSSDSSPGENFTDSQFLVFVNRILALAVALLYIQLKRQPQHKAPLYKYSYSSFSNIMSSWFQYESLKYVGFPTQVLAKSCKVIPVMIMGKFVSNKTFKAYEYVTAALISLGVAIFMLTSVDKVPAGDARATTFSGLIILSGYLLFDAFTSNWQGELFSTYKMSSIQMMAGVNLFSVIFTSVSLIEQGGFVDSFLFMLRHPEFMMHAVILSICSAFGQLFIFYTIAQFGPVVFTIIMTVRQAFAILLSCMTYGHSITFGGFCGVLTVFGAIAAKIYLQRRYKAQKGQSSAGVGKVTGK